jgi:hypothetical protein
MFANAEKIYPYVTKFFPQHTSIHDGNQQLLNNDKNKIIVIGYGRL